MRLPVGYLIGISLLFAALLVGAFVTGYNRRKAEEIRVREAEAVRELDQVVDPLALPAGGRSMPSSSERAPAETDAANSRRGSTGPTPNPQNRVPSGGNRPSTTGNEPRSGAAAPPPSPVQSRPAERERGVVVVTGPADDPRQPGLNYLIAATLPTDEAEKAADFLSSSGLEIALVPADNRPSLRWVVVLRGVAAKDLGGPTARALEQRLQDLGREYKQVHRGPTVFNDPWWKKHSR
ncbi:MAG: hypothetical protein SFZ24_10135 [Planctomycetota bacterium]|nr:hypothetical protein [Planctomycetota bacterium]